MYMSPKIQYRRLTAVKLAKAINKIEGVPVTSQAKRLSAQWARGEISGMEMKAAHKRSAMDVDHE